MKKKLTNSFINSVFNQNSLCKITKEFSNNYKIFHKKIVTLYEQNHKRVFSGGRQSFSCNITRPQTDIVEKL